MPFEKSELNVVEKETKGKQVRRVSSHKIKEKFTISISKVDGSVTQTQKELAEVEK